MCPASKNTPALVFAAHRGEYGKVERLLKAGASADMSHQGVTAVYGALEFGHVRAAKVLLDHGASPFKKRTKRSLSALHHAVKSEELVKRLLQLGFDPNDADNAQRWTPLHLVRDAKVGHVLLAAGANVNALDKKGMPPLVHCLSRDIALVQLLLRSGAEWWDTSCLFDLALQQGDATGLVLLRHGYPVDARDRSWKAPPLILAVVKRATECVKYLLKHKGTHIDAVDAQGRTALSHAAHGRRQLVQLLLAAGADASLPDKSGKLPVDYASSRDIKVLLEKHKKTTVKRAGAKLGKADGTVPAKAPASPKRASTRVAASTSKRAQSGQGTAKSSGSRASKNASTAKRLTTKLPSRKKARHA